AGARAGTTADLVTLADGLDLATGMVISFNENRINSLYRFSNTAISRRRVLLSDTNGHLFF
ncbi:MAG TPA: hypothetical protein PLD03_10725, partial [Thiomonas arsenitoxydans]|nr:hypothetical protein [Thiomonas arsenitoxydans]